MSTMSNEWLDARVDLPDSDCWLVVSLAPGEEKDCVIARLEFTDDSEGHGEPYWESKNGELPICNYPFWVYLPGEAPVYSDDPTPWVPDVDEGGME